MAYTSNSASDRLAAVRSAIADVLNTQSYSIRGRSNTRARLADLREMERELQQEAEMESAGSMTSLGVQVPPS